MLVRGSALATTLGGVTWNWSGIIALGLLITKREVEEEEEEMVGAEGGRKGAGGEVIEEPREAEEDDGLFSRMLQCCLGIKSWNHSGILTY